MTPRTFISFDFDNNATEKMLFAGQATNSRTPFEIADWSSKSALPQRTWESIINDKISRCHIMIVLVGRNMSTATGVTKEIQMAQAHNVPYFGVYVDGANQFSNLPLGLARNRVIDWTWPGIAAAIDQVSKEGKNQSSSGYGYRL
jgi:hypothetical protein